MEFAAHSDFLFLTLQLSLWIWKVLNCSPFCSFASLLLFCVVVRRFVFHCKYFHGPCAFEKCWWSNLIEAEALRCIIWLSGLEIWNSTSASTVCTTKELPISTDFTFQIGLRCRKLAWQLLNLRYDTFSDKWFFFPWPSSSVIKILLKWWSCTAFWVSFFLISFLFGWHAEFIPLIFIQKGCTVFYMFR